MRRFTLLLQAEQKQVEQQQQQEGAKVGRYHIK
jgi:hypothetical protein